jgi:hypothetical protein
VERRHVFGHSGEPEGSGKNQEVITGYHDGRPKEGNYPEISKLTGRAAGI